ncbi:MAG: YdcF family protein [Lachnospiraceae bacterium]|nr:YdcF family protein [Lachnospiraceae bacterium]
MAKKNKELIPLKKHKKVIRLADHGRERVLKRSAIFFGVLGVLCALYCVCIGLFLGYGTYFFLIWGVIGAVFGLISLLCAKPSLRRKLPLWFMRTFWVLFGIGLAIFLLVEGLILSRSGATVEDGAEYLIVLGAQWKPTGPSVVLKYRLDAAVKYLKKNPATKVIVSGGKGANEPISEADGMYAYLVEHGIDAARIQKEDKSTSTYENLSKCGLMLDKADSYVVLVTNNFHVFRAEKIARAQGYEYVQGLAADSYPPMQLHNLLREFCGVMKDFLLGNMSRWEMG